MEKDRALLVENILNLALEIIQLLIGEDYIIMKKPNAHEMNVTQGLEVSSKTKDPVEESACPSPVDCQKNDEKILERANNIIHLLTGRISVNEEDVAVYFTIEEWDYLVEHQDFYKDFVNLCSESGLKNKIGKAGPLQPNLLSDKLTKDKNHVETDLEMKCVVSKEVEFQSKLYVEEDSADKTANHTEDNYLSNYANEGPLIADPVMNTLLEPTSTHIYEQAAPWNKLNLPEINIYIPTEHVSGYTSFIKKEASLRTEGNVCTIEDHTAYVKQECWEDCVVDPVKFSESSSISIKKEPDSWQEDLSVSANVLQAGHTKKVNNKPSSHTGSTITNPHAQTVLHQHGADTSAEHYNSMLDFMEGNYGKIMSFSVIKCNDCGRSFNSKSAFTNHQRSKSRGRMYNCSDYQKQFISSPELLKQVPMSGEMNPLTCLECGKYFYSKNLLAQHQWDHFNGKKYSCPECGKRCFSESELDAHQKDHASENKLVCPYCGRSFSRKSDLIRHYKAQTDGRHTFGKEGVLQKSHSEEKPTGITRAAQFDSQRSQFGERMGLIRSGTKKCVCSECGKCFSDEAYLLIHQQCHVGKKPFPCFECGKCFTSKSYLSMHQKTHMGKKPFSCSDCGKSFMNSSYLIKHSSTHTK